MKQCKSNMHRLAHWTLFSDGFIYKQSDYILKLGNLGFKPLWKCMKIQNMRIMVTIQLEMESGGKDLMFSVEILKVFRQIKHTGSNS